MKIRITLVPVGHNDCSTNDLARLELGERSANITGATASPDVLQRHTSTEGVFTFDLAYDGRE